MDIFGWRGGISYEIIALLLVFTPVVLIFLRSDPPAVLAFILAKLVLMSRVIETLLDPRGSMVVSAIGVAAFLLLIPLILWDLGRKQDREAIAEMGIGLVLALVLMLLFRTLGSGQDITTVGWWQVIGWVLAILAGAASVHLSIVEEIKPDVPEPLFMPSVTKRRFKLIGLSIGLMAVMFLLTFAFTSPQVLSSWTDVHFLVILAVMLAVLTLWTWVVVMRQTIVSRLSPAIVLVWNVLFVVALTLMVYVYQIAFPSTPPTSWLYHIPLFLAVVLFPIILLDFCAAKRRVCRQLSLCQRFGDRIFGVVAVFAGGNRCACFHHDRWLHTCNGSVFPRQLLAGASDCRIHSLVGHAAGFSAD